MIPFLQQLINGLSWGSIYALLALGYTMVYGMIRLINFAHGDVYMMGAMLGLSLASFFKNLPYPFALTLVSTMIFTGLLGYGIEKLAYKPVRHAPRINALITAIGVSLLLEYGGQLIFGADPRFFPSLIASKNLIEWKGLSLNNIQLIIIITSVLLMVGLHLLIQKTNIGRAMRAVSFSHLAAQLVGIPLDRIISFTFILGSSLAGAAGILVALANPKVEPLMGIMPGLKAFVAAVLGGIGNIPGALLGGYLLGLSETMITAYWSSTYRDAFAFLILIVILIIKPTGLLGKKTQEKV